MSVINGEAFFGVGLFVVIAGIVTGVSVNSYHSSTLQSEQDARKTEAKLAAIKSGADPLAVSCAFDGASQLCSVLVAKAVSK